MEKRVRELEAQLQTAQNDVKRYASYALRVEQELVREQQRARLRREHGNDDDEDSDGREDRERESFRDYSYVDDDGEGSEYSPWDDPIENAVKQYESWASKITHHIKTSRHDAPRPHAHTELAGGDNQEVDEGRVRKSMGNSERAGGMSAAEVPVKLNDLKLFLLEQKEFVANLGRDNAKLRDMLRARPTRRDLLASYLQIETLHEQIHQLRAKGTTSTSGNQPEAAKLCHPFEDLPNSTRSGLAGRIIDDKLLRWLHVEVAATESQREAPSSSRRNRAATDPTTLRRSFLKENVVCQLALDPAAVASVSASSKKKGSRSSTREELSRRVGYLCSEIVASCCYALDVQEVAKLPRYVEKLQRLAQLAPTYQIFTERLERRLKVFNTMKVGTTRSPMNAVPSQDQILDELMHQVEDILVELDARRDQMKPPGSKAHEVLLESMRLLQVTHVDQISPNIRRMIDSIRTEQEFESDLRGLLGLDESASRKQVVNLLSTFFSELGLPSRHGRP